MDYPVTVESEGVKIQPERMEIDKLYYCIYQNNVLLFYKDQNEILNCYEISEKEIVDEIKQSKNEEIEDLLEKYIQRKNLNH